MPATGLSQAGLGILSAYMLYAQILAPAAIIDGEVGSYRMVAYFISSSGVHL